MRFNVKLNVIDFKEANLKTVEPAFCSLLKTVVGMTIYNKFYV